MHRTIFTTPVLNRFFYFVSVFYLRLAGWKVEGGLPQDASHVIIAAPHTSNWDLLYALTMSFAMHFKVHWMGKDALFRAPFGSIMQWLEGLPIDRSKANSIQSSFFMLILFAKTLVLSCFFATQPFKVFCGRACLQLFRKPFKLICLAASFTVSPQ